MASFTVTDDYEDILHLSKKPLKPCMLTPRNLYKKARRQVMIISIKKQKSKAKEVTKKETADLCRSILIRNTVSKLRKEEREELSRGTPTPVSHGIPEALASLPAFAAQYEDILHLSKRSTPLRPSMMTPKNLRKKARREVLLISIKKQQTKAKTTGKKKGVQLYKSTLIKNTIAKLRTEEKLELKFRAVPIYKAEE